MVEWLNGWLATMVKWFDDSSGEGFRVKSQNMVIGAAPNFFVVGTRIVVFA